MEIGKQYLVTNIRFTDGQFSKDILAGKNRIDDFKIPATTELINAWLVDYGYKHMSDKSAYALFIREALFTNYNVKYDFQLIKELPMSNAFVINELHIIDIIDQKYVEYKTAAVEINVPTAYIANLSADDLMFATDDIEQAIYENMLRQLHLDINVLTLTDQILLLMSEYMSEINAAAPNIISEAAYDLTAKLSGQIDNDKLQVTEDYDLADNVQNAVFELTSALVKDVGEYM